MDFSSTAPFFQKPLQAALAFAGDGALSLVDGFGAIAIAAGLHPSLVAPAGFLLVLATLRLALRALGRALRAAFAPRAFTSPLFAIDGDTVMIRGQSGPRAMRFRVLGLDAPESGQKGGAAATRVLREMLREGPTRVVSTGYDRYGRALARLYDPQGRDIGLRMVRAGYAVGAGWRGRGVELLARLRGAGLWSKGGIENPSRWRRRNRFSRLA